MTMTEIETIENLDFDYTLPCEAYSKFKEFNFWYCQGENPAEWKLVRSCCGFVTFYCDHCLKIKLSMVSLACHECYRVFAPPSTAYAIMERI